jgi:hypothetical protein
MADAITTRGGDYLLALKGNRARWHSEAQALFETSANKRTTAEETRRVHGRNEWRKADVIPAPTARIAGHAAYVRLSSATSWHQKPAAMSVPRHRTAALEYRE